MRFCGNVKCTFQGYEVSCEQIFRMYQTSCQEICRILSVWKCVWCRLMKPTFQDTSQRVEIFFIFGAWKCDFAKWWNPRFKGTKLRRSKCSAFWKPENSIFADSWNLRFKVPRKSWNFLHFLVLKMWLYRVVKSTFTDTIIRVSTFSAFKMNRARKFSEFWQPENAISVYSWNQRFKVPRKECGNFFPFEPCKYDFAESWKPSVSILSEFW